MITRWLKENWAVVIMWGVAMIVLGLLLVGCDRPPAPAHAKPVARTGTR